MLELALMVLAAWVAFGALLMGFLAVRAGARVSPELLWGLAIGSVVYPFALAAAAWERWRNGDG